MERTGTNKNILIIIPSFNEAGNIPALYSALNLLRADSYRIFPLFINDESTDNTKEVLKALKAPFLDNPINLGIGGTVQLGFMYAYAKGFDIAVQMDGDGQHPPAELHKLIEPFLNEEADVVIGSRFINDSGFQSTPVRRLGIRFFYHLNKFLTGARIKDATSGYRAYNQKALAELLAYYPDEYPEPEAIIYLVNKKMRIKEVAVTMNERTSGTSSIRRFNTIYYMTKVTFNSIFLHLKMKLNG